MVEVKIQLLSENAVFPEKATDGAACRDVSACLDEPVTILPGRTELIPTGFAMAVPEGYAAFVFARSGLGIKKEIAPGNCVGVVDSDYRGEVKVGLWNRGGLPYTIMPGDRIAQIAILPVPETQWTVAEELPESGRGAGGFGSTGK
ncbi:MAG TPA: dUTP diphosphatase [Oscillospiraceae bacterium]|nr:dUTP diphosphatase [Oscillospiraceae bacterium]